MSAWEPALADLAKRDMMAIVVIGGQARKVGKTSVVTGLITAMPDQQWTAVKISQHAHDRDAGASGREAADMKEREWPISKERDWAISEEHDCSGGSDTSRFLAAGAKRALWVRANPGRLAEAIPVLESELERAGHAIIESNSVVRFIRPDVYLVVLDPANPDVKESAREFLESADGVILHEQNDSGSEASEISISPEKPVFRITPPNYVTREMVEFVRSRVLQGATG